MLNLPLLLALLLFGLVGGAAGHGGASAPKSDGQDKSWCRGSGSPTRTTGECICRQACAGPGCKREQGLSWYTQSCATCKCVARNDPAVAKQKAPSKVSDPQQQQQQQYEPESAEKSGKREERAEPAELSSDPILLLQEFVEDNSGLVFAALALLSVVAAGLVMLALRADTQSEEQEQRAAKTTKAGNADKDEARSVGAESSSDSGKANSTAAAMADKKAD